MFVEKFTTDPFISLSLASLAFFLGLFVIWRTVAAESAGPIAFLIQDPEPTINAAFVASVDQGNYGEALTSVLITKDGWKQLPSKYDRIHGIDGLFVKEVEGGIEVLIAETKTNTATLDDGPLGRQMSDPWVIDRLDKIYVLGLLPEKMFQSIIDGLKEDSPFVKKQLWHHELATGVTTIYKLDSDADQTRLQSIPNDLRDQESRRHHYRLMEGLAYALNDFDRGSSYMTMADRPQLP